MDTKQHLILETEKWFKKAQDAAGKMRPVDDKGRDFVKNIDAYLSDSRHFLEKGDHVRAFEAVIWAWAWLEIGKDIGVIEW